MKDAEAPKQQFCAFYTLHPCLERFTNLIDDGKSSPLGRLMEFKFIFA